MVDEAMANKGIQYQHLGTSCQTLPDGTMIRCTFRDAVTGGSRNIQTTRTEWLVNGVRRSKAVCEKLLNGRGGGA